MSANTLLILAAVGVGAYYIMKQQEPKLKASSSSLPSFDTFGRTTINISPGDWFIDETPEVRDAMTRLQAMVRNAGITTEAAEKVYIDSHPEAKALEDIIRPPTHGI